jgi:hypothetical protein
MIVGKYKQIPKENQPLRDFFYFSVPGAGSPAAQRLRRL